MLFPKIALLKKTTRKKRKKRKTHFAGHYRPYDLLHVQPSQPFRPPSHTAKQIAFSKQMVVCPSLAIRSKVSAASSQESGQKNIRSQILCVFLLHYNRYVKPHTLHEHATVSNHMIHCKFTFHKRCFTPQKYGSQQ